MSFIRKNWQKIFILMFVLSLPVLLLADTNDKTCNPASGKICNPLGATSSIPALIEKILEGFLKIGIPLVALAIIYSGFLFVAAMGNSEKLSKAKETLMYTLIGAAILLGSWAIAKLIANTVLGLGS